MAAEKGHLTNKVAWVTGSSRGIGRVIASHLASQGAAVAVHGTTPTSTQAFGEGNSLEEVAAGIAEESGSRVLPVFGDLTDEGVVQAMAGKIRQELGAIDILVNCAGGDIGAAGISAPMAGKPPENNAVFIALEDIRMVLDRNLMTCILCSREVAPEMMERKKGHIVSIGSVAGLMGAENSAIYATAKAAVHEYTRCLADMLRSYNVTANVIAPGDIETLRFLASRVVDEDMRTTDGTLVRYGQSIEIARAVEFLASEKNTYITGQVLRVDGGKQIWAA
ncbi:MAG: SDR family NAD(P)-dependent oxidoreductase [Candidatus Latescibacterota bacterium]|jgi:3-oxoacyl-[acyl-carrier protein] reductase